MIYGELYNYNGGGFVIFNASSKIAVKCSECGKYNVVELNLFKLRIPTSLLCNCGHRMLKAHISTSTLVLEVDCIACENQHRFNFKLKEIMEESINIISCPTTGMEIAFLGKNDNVTDIMERYVEDMQEVFKSLGVIKSINAK